MIGLLRRRLLLLATRLIASTRRRMLGPHVHALLCETENGRLLIHASDFSIGKKLAFDGRYQMDNLRELLDLVGPESKVLVVGVHVGSFLIPLSRKVREIVGIEANPVTRDLLEINLRINDVRNARILGIAASDRSCMVEFLANPSNTGGSKIRQAGEPWEFVYDSPECIQVQAEPLDTLVDDAFDLVVMDVEGAEYQALRGMESLLQRCKVLQVEYIPFAQEAAGVSPHDFAALMSRHFARARVAGGKTGREWTKTEFDSMLSGLRSEGNSLGEDFLFFKE